MKNYVIMLLAIAPIFAFAQNTSLNFAVNGLSLGGHYTDAQVRTALGQPTRYITWNDEMGGGREYQYGGVNNYDVFRFEAENGLVDIGLATSSYSLFNSRIKVGDNISKFSQLGQGILMNFRTNEYRFFPSGQETEEFLGVSTNSSGVITYLGLSLPIY